MIVFVNQIVFIKDSNVPITVLEISGDAFLGEFSGGIKDWFLMSDVDEIG